MSSFEPNYKQIFEAVGDAIFIVNPNDLRIQGVNEAGCELFGYSRAELLEMNADALSDVVNARQCAFELMEGALRNGPQTFEWRCRPKQGDAVWVEVTAKYTELGGKECVLATARCIDQRRRAQQALFQSEARFRAIFDTTRIGISLCDIEGEGIFANHAYQKMLGCTSEYLRHRDAYGELTHPDDREKDAALYDRLLEGEYDHYEQEKRYLLQDGSLVYAILNFHLLRNFKGERMFVMAMAEDITERKTLEDQLRQSQKMDAIGRLAGGIAHDFNNLLTVIHGYGEILQEELSGKENAAIPLHEIRKAVDRASSLTAQLLAFSRKQVLAPKVLDINAIVHNMNRMLHRLLGEDIDLQTIFEASLGRVKADPSQIEQVIMNLAVNSRDAMPNGGKLTIETANVTLDKAYASEYTEVPAGEYVMFAVSDTGIGIEQDSQSQIFEPFFTTKKEGEGTGLGLSTVYGIVRQSGGHVAVYSHPGMGTTLKVYLPRVDDLVDLAPAEQAGAGAHSDSGSETLLLVEDEEPLRAMVSQVLAKKGYNVLAAEDADRALEISAGHPGPIHILLTDVVLRQMNGHEMARKVVAERPSTRVLFMSGYTPDAMVRHGIIASGAPFLQKPFTNAALVKKVREVLDAA